MTSLTQLSSQRAEVQGNRCFTPCGYKNVSRRFEFGVAGGSHLIFVRMQLSTIRMRSVHSGTQSTGLARHESMITWRGTLKPFDHVRSGRSQ
jgi:hypothetical protein